MSAYVLVHGAWHGGWCWDRIIPLLQDAGNRVLTLDLPGHGKDKTAPSKVTLKDYTDRLCRIISHIYPCPHAPKRSISFVRL
ncbi:alpha/beta fold hydrolase [Peribacillus sp. NPDC060186]